MRPLYTDIVLNDEQKRIVTEYIREVGFCLPGTSPEDFHPVDVAVYAGWNFQSEDLESFVVGLTCTKPGFEHHHTFIRVSHGQLTGDPDARRLPVNAPVLATDTLRMQRWRDTPTGPSRTGIDAYATSDGTVPGADLDLAMLADTLADVASFARSGGTRDAEGQFDLALDLGTLFAGRYPRLTYYRAAGRLSDAQLDALRRVERTAKELEPTLISLGLPTLGDLATPERRRHPQHNG